MMPKPRIKAITTVQCLECGKENKKEAIYCAECGCKLENQERYGINSCPYCGKDNIINAKFCAKCGEEIKNKGKPELTSCPSCGSENPNYADFCNRCGNALNNGSGMIIGNNLEDLEKLAELKEKGIISEEEFQAKKKQILGL